MTTNETNQIVRWMVIIVLGAATAGMAAVSLRANFLFGFGFGQTPEKAQVFGWANVAADLWKVSGLNGQEIAQVVPFEHGGTMHFCLRDKQTCGCRAAADRCSALPDSASCRDFDKCLAAVRERKMRR